MFVRQEYNPGVEKKALRALKMLRNAARISIFFLTTVTAYM
jgi:hypothetical protein